MGNPGKPSDKTPKVVKPTRPLSSVSPEEMADMKVAPGDPYIKAAFDRLNRPAPTKLLRDSGGTDSLVIEKAAKRSRSLTFSVQGIMWRAGFAKDLSQTPLGQYTRLVKLPTTPLQDPNGAIIRPIGMEFEPVFRELVPPQLISACEKMYGIVRMLEKTSLFYFPRDEGATAGIMAYYGDGAASRSHILYLQTNIKNASPTVLDQIQKTFEAALPKAKEIAQRSSQVDFWKEMERSLYQVRATFHASGISKGSHRMKSGLKAGMKSVNSGIDQAFNVAEEAGKLLDIVLSFPSRGLLALIKGFSRFLIWIITGLDRLLPK